MTGGVTMQKLNVQHIWTNKSHHNNLESRNNPNLHTYLKSWDLSLLYICCQWQAFLVKLHSAIVLQRYYSTWINLSEVEAKKKNQTNLNICNSTRATNGTQITNTKENSRHYIPLNCMPPVFEFWGNCNFTPVLTVNYEWTLILSTLHHCPCFDGTHYSFSIKIEAMVQWFGQNKGNDAKLKKLG
jgi:hypothetical protein